MILTGPEIVRQIKLGNIVVDTFDEADINPNSVNYRLGSKLVELQDDCLDIHQPSSTKEHELTADGFLLSPGKVYLGYTKETIGSDCYVMSLIGRSTLGRLGLWLQVSADIGHLGTCNHWTLELRCVQPLLLFPGMIIGQVSFWRPTGEIGSLYHGKYIGENKAKPSDMYLERT